MPQIGLQITVKAIDLEWDKKGLKTALRAAGNEVAGVARKLVRQSTGGGRTYYIGGSGGGKGRYRASAPGQPPTSVTGLLAKSIKVRVFRSGEGVAVRDTAYYSLFLEGGAQGGQGKRVGKHRRGNRGVGARVLKPRPFLSRALNDRRASLEQRLGEAIAKGLKFRRVKA